LAGSASPISRRAAKKARWKFEHNGEYASEIRIALAAGRADSGSDPDLLSVPLIARQCRFDADRRREVCQQATASRRSIAKVP
jgi:hypothetical protein